MKIQDIEIMEFIMPRKLIYKNDLYQITKLAKKFEIKGYIVKTVNDKIDMVILNNPHPNAIPRTGEFCIPNSLRRHKLTKESKSMIFSMLSCFNLDDCYFTPWDEIKYEKQEVLETWKKNN
ncbi:hypothetical protein KAR91_88310 [Candidatus Pacearchaeota archaeon]|nr:hypothetical protein [Candidatus Pacearchaeota archaeon]